MSGMSSSTKCPICGEEMNINSENRPFDSVGGECYFCGFCYYTQVVQLSLEEINCLREDYELKPLKAKDLKKYSKKIKEIW